jgi:hypothetical protein
VDIDARPRATGAETKIAAYVAMDIDARPRATGAETKIAGYVAVNFSNNRPSHVLRSHADDTSLPQGERGTEVPL